MIRRLAILLAVGLAVLLVRPAAAPADGPPSLEPFLREHGLAEVFRSRPLTQAMASRWEAVASSGGFLHGLVAYHDKNRPAKPGLMAFFCRLAILRHKMKPLEEQVAQKTGDGRWVEEVLRLAVVECRIRDFKTLALARMEGWSVCVCRIRPQDIILPDPPPKPETYLARAAYNLGRAALNKGDQALALEWFKQTRTAPEVYRNSLAYLVPLIHTRDRDLAAQVDRKFLRPSRVDDPQALAYLTRFRMSAGQTEAAGETCARCLELDPDHRECRALMNSVNQARMQEGLAYDNFFSQP